MQPSLAVATRGSSSIKFGHQTVNTINRSEHTLFGAQTNMFCYQLPKPHNLNAMLGDTHNTQKTRNEKHIHKHNIKLDHPRQRNGERTAPSHHIPTMPDEPRIGRSPDRTGRSPEGSALRSPPPRLKGGAVARQSDSSCLH